MAEKDKDNLNDDYQFGDLDTGDSMGFEPEKEDKSYSETYTPPTGMGKEKAVIVKALAVAGVVAFLMLSYVYILPRFTAKKPEQTAEIPKIEPIQKAEAPKPAPIQTSPPPPPVVSSSQKILEDKIQTIELNQQNVRNEVSNVGNQVSGMTSSISELNTQISKLNQLIETLSAKVTEQAETIEALKPKPKKVVRPNTRAHYKPTIFYLQAIIPGRAWLISTTGATLTVREGSSVPGYGTIKLIDAQQGRVLTNSGKVIQFSREDS
jgi:intracellular multiplication protein IcmG